MYAFGTWIDVGIGYVFTFTTLGVFIARTLLRGHRLARLVPDKDKPWT
jgi:hypothetical protein